MALSLTDIRFLQSEQGQALLIDLNQRDLSPNNLLPIITKLRDHYEQAVVHAAISMAQNQQAAVAKFGDMAHHLFFTDDALQQASDPFIRAYRAQDVSGMKIVDVCCGIGTDSLTFAQAGASVIGYDLDPVRIAIAQHNAAMLELDVTFEVLDVTQDLPLADVDLVFFDPARRTAEGKRIYDVDAYLPPLSLIHQWDVPRIMVKISPGVDLEQLADYDATVEFISVGGDLKEAVLHQPKTHALLATLIQDGQVQHWYPQKEELSVAMREPSGWLIEPDPSILRANLVQDVVTHFDGWMLDPQIAYFCAEEALQSPWVRSWKIREWLPFNLKKLRARLKAMDIGTLTVKKRGSPITPEDLIRKLKLKGSQSATVVLTRLNDALIAIICDDILPV